MAARLLPPALVPLETELRALNQSVLDTGAGAGAGAAAHAQPSPTAEWRRSVLEWLSSCLTVAAAAAYVKEHSRLRHERHSATDPVRQSVVSDADLARHAQLVEDATVPASKAWRRTLCGRCCRSAPNAAWMGQYSRLQRRWWQQAVSVVVGGEGVVLAEWRPELERHIAVCRRAAALETLGQEGES
eukprot:SAG22_NODE_5293_length_1043_cov_1.011653_1_plen_187_part_00